MKSISFLYDNLFLLKHKYLIDEIKTINEYHYKLNELLKKSKEIHKNEIIESYCKGCFDISKDENIFPRETSEEYYKKTFINE